MITFVTAYDPETKANLSALIAHLPAQALTAAGANRGALIARLRLEPGSAVGIWSHGTHRGPREQGGAIALTVEDVRSIDGRPAYAFACHTGTRFGRIAAAAGWQWWGYTGAISAPGDGTEESAIVGSAFWSTFDLFIQAAMTKEVTSALSDVRAIAEQALAQLDLIEASPDSHLCLLHLWDRLRVWLPEAEEPIAPFGCASPITIEDL